MQVAPGETAEAVLGALAGSGLVAVWSSPAIRCQSLAAPVAAALGCEIFLDERLLEMDFGDWEGRTWDDVPRVGLDAWAADPWGFIPPHGESARDVLVRVRGFAEMLIEHGEDSAVVSHGGPLKLLHAILQGRQPDPLARPQPFGSLVWIQQAVSAP